MAVDARVRAGGIGTALMRTLFAELPALRRREDAPVLLATQRESNLRFYARFGFSVTHEATLASARGRARFTSWFMRQAS